MNEDSGNVAGSSEARALAELQARMQRPGQEVNREGSFELGWGIALLCFGVVPYFNAVVTKSAWYAPWMAWMVYLPLLCAAFAPYAVPKVIKRFITWPRTGYVANPTEIKLIQLVKLMVFGLAIGGVVGQLIVLVWGLGARGEPGSGFSNVTLTWIELLLFAALAVYLGRKVIRKRAPLPSAYDPAVITQSIQETPSGRSILRVVRFSILVMFIGLPIVVSAIVFGLMYWNRSHLHPTEMSWSEWGVPGFIVVVNALLYFMGSGVVLKPHRWKWFVLPAMLLVPILVAPILPEPAAKSSLFPMFNSLPPVTLCLGSVWVLSGAIALLVYLHHNRLPAEAS